MTGIVATPGGPVRLEVGRGSFTVESDAATSWFGRLLARMRRTSTRHTAASVVQAWLDKGAGSARLRLQFDTGATVVYTAAEPEPARALGAAFGALLGERMAVRERPGRPA